MEKRGFQDRQDVVHRDVEKITSAVYEVFANFIVWRFLTAFTLFLTVSDYRRWGGGGRHDWNGHLLEAYGTQLTPSP